MMKRLSKLSAALLAVVGITAGGNVLAADAHKGHNHASKDVKAYPLKTCVVSGEKLGGMGDPYVHKHEGREIKFCCKGCLKDFNKDPKKFVKKLEEAEKKSAH
jgi:YHS domain-containing protein